MSAEERRTALAERAAALGIVGRCSSCGELWPSCKCGVRKPPPLIEWVAWKTRKPGIFGDHRSLYHVRLSSGGRLLCGTRPPEGNVPAADSLVAVERRCSNCLGKLARDAKRAAS